MIIGLVQSLRPKQWTKNLLVFAGYLFSVDQGHPASALIVVLAAFGIFCAISGAGYLINDSLDVERDRIHPRKCKRPIASGRVSVAAAVGFAVILLGASLIGSFWIGFWFGVLTAGYFVLTLCYSLCLKHVVIVDLLAISAGFVLRAVAGAVAIDVAISSWLLVCTTLLALFLGLAKRRAELVTLENGGVGHRKTLEEYSAPMLDQFLTVTSSACLMAYFLYTFAPDAGGNGPKHPYMMITVPFVIYGLFRYLYLIHNRNAGGSPEQVLLEDRPLLLNLLLFVVAAAAAILL